MAPEKDSEGKNTNCSSAFDYLHGWDYYSVSAFIKYHRSHSVNTYHLRGNVDFLKALCTLGIFLHVFDPCGFVVINFPIEYNTHFVAS